MFLAAIVPLWATWITARKRSEGDYTRALEQRLRDAEQRLAAEEKANAELRAENVDLMRRLFRANGA